MAAAAWHLGPALPLRLGKLLVGPPYIALLPSLAHGSHFLAQNPIQSRKCCLIS